MGEILDLQIGNIEMEKKKKLEPAKVKIVKVIIETIEKAKANKAIFEVKHPSSEDTIKISAVSVLQDKKIKTIGTWISTDKENNLQKGTALAVFLDKIGVKSLRESIGKEINTESNEDGYLVFIAY